MWHVPKLAFDFKMFCFSALADIAGGKKNVLVPYRNSVLTKLLQTALGGNSRTIMVTFHVLNKINEITLMNL